MCVKIVDAKTRALITLLASCVHFQTNFPFTYFEKAQKRGVSFTLSCRVCVCFALCRVRHSLCRALYVLAITRLASCVHFQIIFLLLPPKRRRSGSESVEEAAAWLVTLFLWYAFYYCRRFGYSSIVGCGVQTVYFAAFSYCRCTVV